MLPLNNIKFITPDQISSKPHGPEQGIGLAFGRTKLASCSPGKEITFIQFIVPGKAAIDLKLIHIIENP